VRGGPSAAAALRALGSRASCNGGKPELPVQRRFGRLTRQLDEPMGHHGSAGGRDARRGKAPWRRNMTCVTAGPGRIA